MKTQKLGVLTAAVTTIAAGCATVDYYLSTATRTARSASYSNPRRLGTSPARDAAAFSDMNIKQTVFDVIQPDCSNSSANRWFDRLISTLIVVSVETVFAADVSGGE